LFVILASIFIAIAGQQAAYVQRLDKLRRAIKPQGFLNEATAAYFLVASGFWSFSLAVPSTLGFIFAHTDMASAPVRGMYQGFIITQFIGGWIFLMGGALLKFETRPYVE
jgi:hypothetical protein